MRRPRRRRGLADLARPLPDRFISRSEDVASLNGAPAGRRRFLTSRSASWSRAPCGRTCGDYTAALKQRKQDAGSSGREVDGTRSSRPGRRSWPARARRLDRRREELTAESWTESFASWRTGSTPTLSRPGHRTTRAWIRRRAERGRVWPARVRQASRGFRDRAPGVDVDRDPHRPRRWLPNRGARELNDGTSRGDAQLYSILLRLAFAQVLDATAEEPPVVFLDDPGVGAGSAVDRAAAGPGSGSDRRW